MTDIDAALKTLKLLTFLDPTVQRHLDHLKRVTEEGVVSEDHFLRQLRLPEAENIALTLPVKDWLYPIADRPCRPEELDEERAASPTERRSIGPIPPLSNPFFARYVLTLRGHMWWSGATREAQTECLEALIADPVRYSWVAHAIAQDDWTDVLSRDDALHAWDKLSTDSRCPKHVLAVAGAQVLPHVVPEAIPQVIDRILERLVSNAAVGIYRLVLVEGTVRECLLEKLVAWAEDPKRMLREQAGEIGATIVFGKQQAPPRSALAARLRRLPEDPGFVVTRMFRELVARQP